MNGCGNENVWWSDADLPFVHRFEERALRPRARSG